MKKHSMIWLYLALIFLALSIFSFYYLFYFLSAFFMAIVLLNLIILFFDCQKGGLCRFFIAIFTRYSSVFFLSLFIVSITERIYSFLPKMAIKETIIDFIWLWPILFIIYYSLSVFFAKIIKTENYRNLVN